MVNKKYYFSYNRSEYRAWWNMLSRCYNKKTPKFELWGGRGITVCNRWRFGENGKSGFECFMIDMGEKPDPTLMLERRNNFEHYEPANCYWATLQEQLANRRPYRPRNKA